MAQLDYRPRFLPLRWLLNVGHGLSEDVAVNFQSSFFRSRVPILSGGLNSTIIALLGWLRLDEPRLLLLALFDVMTIAVRLLVIHHARAGRIVPDFLFVASLAWCMSQAAATTLIFHSHDILLIIVVSVSTVAAASGIAARNFGAPRFAMTQILILDLTFKVNVLLIGWSAMAFVIFAQSGLFLLTNLGLIISLRTLAIRALEGEAASRALAARDPLTGLANRRGLEDAYAARNGEHALFAIDLDGFKAINDRHGHGAGDAILLSVAARLRKRCINARAVCRIGGDEFVVLFDTAPAPDARIFGQRLVAALSAPYLLEGVGHVRVGASVGVAIGAGETLKDLAAAADHALYAAKQAGKGRCVVAGAPTAPAIAEGRVSADSPMVHAIA